MPWRIRPPASFGTTPSPTAKRCVITANSPSPHWRWKTPRSAANQPSSISTATLRPAPATSVVERRRKSNPCARTWPRNGFGWNLGVPDVFRAAQFIEDLKKFEQTGAFPESASFSGCPTTIRPARVPARPRPPRRWRTTTSPLARWSRRSATASFGARHCIFAIEDDPQAGWDHASAYRTTAYVASPYTKRGQVVALRTTPPALCARSNSFSVCRR